MTNSAKEVLNAEVILVTGSNTTENHPVIGNMIKHAVRYNGAKLIVIDPRAIELTKYATIWMRQKSGTDVAWMNGMMNVIINEGLFNRDFVENRTENFEAFKETVSKYTPERVEEISDIPKEKLISAARLFAKAKKGMLFYSMGITQHITGVDNVKSCANLQMLTGHLGIESGGVNPLRGQSNVQGACDMGCLPNVFTAYQAVINEDFVKKFQDAWGVEVLSNKVGLTIPDMINNAYSGKLKALYVFSENPMLSDPNINHLREALAKLDLLIVQDMFLTESTELAHVVLPGTSFAEKDGTFTNTGRRVQRIRKAIEPIGNSKPDWLILTELAGCFGHDWKYRDPEDIFDEMRKLTPSYAGMNYKRLDNEGGLQWPCPNEEHPGTPYLHKEKFTRGKGLFHAIEFIPPAEMPDDEYPFVLNTGRLLYHYHTGTLSRKVKALNAIVPEGYVELSPFDARRLKISDNEMIEVKSRRGKIEIKAKITDMVDAGRIFIPFHFKEAAANLLTNDAFDPVAKIPEYKVCAASIRKLD
jgi:formate dehydrogenase alpha subunit